MKKWHIYTFSACSLVIMAFLSIGYLHPDEHFQILEFAGLKLGITPIANLPWEYYEQMRPAIQPAMVVVAYHIFFLFGSDDPFAIAFFLRILSALVSFLSMWMIYRVYSKKINHEVLKKWFLLLSFLLWFAIYLNVRFCAETWSGSLFITGFALYLMQEQKPKSVTYLLAGFVLGLSFIFRYQAGLFIFGMLCWSVFIKRERFVNLFLLSLGIISAILAGLLLDRWFYGEWTLTAWNYFRQNILLDKISSFGIQPWWFYLADVFTRGIPPFSLVYIFSFILFFIFYRKDVLTWTLLPYILFHFLISHKEIRFFFPMIGFIPVILIRSMELIKEKWERDLTATRFTRNLARLFWIANLACLGGAVFNPADNQVYLYKKVYSGYKQPVTLYYSEEDPYRRALDVFYYKRKSLVLKKLNSWDEINNDTGDICLFAAKSRDQINNITRPAKLIYSSYPGWVTKFNVNHWVERTHFWYLYEVEAKH